MLVNYFMRRYFASTSKIQTQQTIASILRAKPLDQKLKLVGWLKKYRKYKDKNFIHLDDGSTLQRLQIVVPKSVCPKTMEYHSCLCVEGSLVQSPGPKQSVEVFADKVTVLSPGAPLEYPYVERGTYLKEDLRALPQYRPRTRDFAALLRVRSQAKNSFRKYFERERFTNVDTPILTQNNCEGAGDVFAVMGHSDVNLHDGTTKMGESMFGFPVYLSVSGQLHLEAMTSGFSRVYNFNPAFRADTGSRLHLQEFWMLEAEEAFLEGRNGYGQLMNRIEDTIKFATKDLLEVSEDDVQFLLEHNEKEYVKDLLLNVLDKPFVRLKYHEAIQILTENQHKLNQPTIDPTQSLNRQSEFFLTEYCGNAPVFVTDWPIELMPFYTYAETRGEGEVGLGVDLLMPLVGEVVGGGLREHRYDRLKTNLEKIQSAEKLDWYMDLRKWGYAPSGGFGLGFERFLQFVTGIENIKDTIPYPRSYGQCHC